jgi:xanthine dehydrogenase accessory factor
VENLDVAVLRALRDWRVCGRHAVLVTVVHTWGSSPRPPGSIMAMVQGGQVVGSVSGGCIEDDLLFRYAQAWGGLQYDAFASPQRVRYGVSADDAHRFGLPCGGTVELVLEHDPDAALLGDLVACLEAGKLVRRVLSLGDGGVQLEAAISPEELRVDEAHLVNTFGPEYRLLLIGAGQLSQCLAGMALPCGFAVTVCDPRIEYHGDWNLPGVTVVKDMPDDVVQAFRADVRTAIVALTHDPKLDDLALLEALESPAFYVGAIGSRRNNQARRARLIEHFGQTPASLERLRGPIGLYVGSKTPSEIAVSVMADIVATKNGVLLPAAMDVQTAKDLA